MPLPKELVERMVKWGPDEKGACWKKCPAFTADTHTCEGTGASTTEGGPCQVYRLRITLGREGK